MPTIPILTGFWAKTIEKAKDNRRVNLIFFIFIKVEYLNLQIHFDKTNHMEN
jgi:hypothetical protein